MTSLKEKLKRIVIFGNSGSGKSYFARQFSAALDSPIIHFDEHFWEPGGFNKKRPPEVVHSEIKQLDPIAAENSFKELLSWAEAYAVRENSRSLKGHAKIYSSFNGDKHEFHDRQSAEAFLLNL